MMIDGIDKLKQAADLIEEFCAKTRCIECPIKKACDRAGILPIGQIILRSVKGMD